MGDTTTCTRKNAPTFENLEFSYVHGASSEATINRTVGWFLEEASRYRPNLDAFAFPDFNQTLSYADLVEQTYKVARGLLVLGIEKGDRIVVIGFNGADWLTMFLAGVTIGAIYNGPYLYKPKNELLLRILTKLECKAVVLLGQQSTENLKLLWTIVDDAEISVDKNIQSKRFPSLKYVITTDGERGSLSLAECVARGSSITEDQLNSAKSTVSPNDGLIIFCSTGTTGAPKFPMWNHFAQLNSNQMLKVPFDLNSKDRVIATQSPRDDDICPIAHVVLTLMTYDLNTRIVFLPDLTFTDVKQDCHNYLQTIQDYRVNAMMCYPHVWILCFLQNEEIDKYDLTHLTRGVTAGWKVQPAIALPLVQRVPGFVVSYCCSEYFPITVNFSDDELERKCKTVGYPTPHTEIKLVDEKNQIVAIGEIGEVHVRGPAKFSLYWGDPDLTSSSIDADGWFHTGDLGKLNRNGSLTFIGRKADSIRFKVWGDIVYPGYIEDSARLLDCVAEAKVVGVPNDLKGSDIVLCVVIKPGFTFSENDIIVHLKKQLTLKDLPDYVLQFEKFPKIGSRRKIPKQAMEEMVSEKLMEMQKKSSQEYAEQYT